jgi:uncharacterized membrane protein YdjX (TVP38/TMEM64 family)
MRRFLPLILICLVAAALYAGLALRTQVGVEDFADSLRTYILTLGLWAPIAFTTLVTFRQYVALPSSIALAMGGLVFGATLGGALGGLGIALSSIQMFGLARGIARGWIQGWAGERLRRLDTRANAAGPFVVALITAHPMGIVSPTHWAAGVSSMRWKRFAAWIVPASFIRAYTFAYLGSTLLDIGSKDFFIATGVVLAIALLPLLHPTVRQNVFGRRAGNRVDRN